MSVWTVRPAAPGDDAIAMALEQSFGPPAGARNGHARFENAGGTVLLAWDDAGTPQGLAVWRSLGEEAELLSISVVPAARRRGAGRALLHGVFRAARAGGARRLLLEVSARNEAAQGLYRATGFAPLSVRKRYYRDGSDAIVMQVAL